MSPRELNSDAFYKKWSFVASIGNILFLILVINTGLIFYLLAFNLLSFAAYLSQAKKKMHGYPFVIGYANWITLLRLTLIFTAAATLTWANDYITFIILTIAVALDGVDGFVARNYKQQTQFGARLDMETDAFFVLLLSTYHVQEGNVPFWIIWPGVMRYIYGVFTHFAGSGEEITSRKFRATVAVLFFIVLLSASIIPHNLSIIASSIAGGLILFSFGMSFIGFFLSSLK
ncbi:MAG: CDP-alcohol phosphatidyltransferase family protein [Bacteroidota bacterium]